VGVEGSETLTNYGLLDIVPMFDEVLQGASPHYKYAKSKANGIALVDVTASEIDVTFAHVKDV
jgi:hypothetical protein